MNKQHITVMYKKLQEKVKTDKFYTEIDLENRTNKYTCPECGHGTITKDIDAGVTPFYHTCEECGEMAVSSFFRNPEGAELATEEWYRPTLEECIKLKKDEGTLDHVLKGGLLVRKIKK